MNFTGWNYFLTNNDLSIHPVSSMAIVRVARYFHEAQVYTFIRKAIHMSVKSPSHPGHRISWSARSKATSLAVDFWRIFCLSSKRFLQFWPTGGESQTFYLCRVVHTLRVVGVTYRSSGPVAGESHTEVKCLGLLRGPAFSKVYSFTQRWSWSPHTYSSKYRLQP